MWEGKNLEKTMIRFYQEYSNYEVNCYFIKWESCFSCKMFARNTSLKKAKGLFRADIAYVSSKTEVDDIPHVCVCY